MNGRAKRLVCVACCLLAVTLLPLTFTGCASTSTRESTGEYIDDVTITTKVKAKLAGDPKVSAMQVNVETFKGVVQLSGFVDSKDQAKRAEELARNVRGVKDVKNDIVVKAGS